MKFHTSISKTENGVHVIRGHDLIELMEKHSFVEVIFLLLRGSLPEERERELMETMLVAPVENGLEAPSIFIPRIVASTGNNFHTALAAGVLAIGERHGGAGEAAAQLFSSGKSAVEIVDEYIRNKKILPGFGHKIYKEEDPRATAIYKRAKELGFSCRYFELAYAIEQEFAKQKGKKIPLNIDGALAAGLLELGFDARLGKAFFLISRIIGMSAHILEELNQNNPYYRLEESEVTPDENAS
ncbi:MAG: citryl-CoA lyase [Candidatus Wildermuthbacteria bacterium]|nr:citryl-CoA lyase [Candidatus Wildermuthbacteria bacterium]